MTISWKLSSTGQGMVGYVHGYSYTILQQGGTHPGQLKCARSDVYRRLSMMNERAPVGSLPADVLILIFEAANRVASPNYDPWAYRKHHQLPFPIIVSQVSRTWRDVAVNSPLLWTQIDISPPWSSWSLNMIRLFLTRSKSCPIDLKLRIPSMACGILLSPSSVNGYASHVSSIIEPHISRSRSISIIGDFDETSPMLFTLLDTIRMAKMPILKTFTLRVAGISELDDAQDLSIFHHGAPSLQSVRLTGPILSWNSSLVQVTTLHLGAGDGRGISYTEFLSAISFCKRLETLTIYDDLIVGFWPDNALIDLPFLRSLQLYGPITTISDLLLAICAPQLEDLVIAPAVVDDLSTFHDYSSISAPKFPALTSLTLAPASTYSFGVLKLASDCFPTVRQLAIPNIHKTSFTSILTDATSVLWPKLESLALRNVDGYNENALLTVVAFRKSIGCPLQKVFLDAESLARIADRLPELESNVDVVEFDLWASRRDKVSNEHDHITGADFDLEDIFV